ncbi:UNVERIFIED_CONTAM: hypothetical protein RMT77_009016 [Armadillidium vulgare]
MSSEESDSHLNSNKSLKYYFTKTTNFIDENLRIIQYTIYGTAAVGVVLSLRSLNLFSKFSRIEDIPEEYILKQIKLRGIVNDVKYCKNTQFDTVNMETNNYTNRTISPTSSFSINNADVVKENGWMEKLKGKLLYFSKRKSVVKDSSELAHIYLHVSHLPIIQRKTTEEQNLVLKMASIQVTEEGAKKAKNDLQGKKIWFIPLKISEEEKSKVLECIIRPTASYYGNYSNILVKNQWALVDLYDQTLENNKAYKKYYKKLVKIQDRQDRIIFILLRKICNFILRK